MYCLSVLYGSQPDGHFDLEDYAETHIQLEQDRLGPGGLLRYELAKGWPGGRRTPRRPTQ
jgi:hypothetical protein